MRNNFIKLLLITFISAAALLGLWLALNFKRGAGGIWDTQPQSITAESSDNLVQPPVGNPTNQLEARVSREDRLTLARKNRRSWDTGPCDIWHDGYCAFATQAEIENWLNKTGHSAENYVAAILARGPGTGYFINKALELFPNNPAILETVCVMQLHKPHSSELIRKCIEAGSQNPYLHLLVARELAQKGDKKAALEALRAANQSAGVAFDFGSTKSRLYDLYHSAGRTPAQIAARVEFGTSHGDYSFALLQARSALLGTSGADFAPDPELLAPIMDWAQRLGESPSIPIEIHAQLLRMEQDMARRLAKDEKGASLALGMPLADYSKEVEQSIETRKDAIWVSENFLFLTEDLSKAEWDTYFNDVAQQGLDAASTNLRQRLRSD
jgi:hypothetical protein